VTRWEEHDFGHGIVATLRFDLADIERFLKRHGGVTMDEWHPGTVERWLSVAAPFIGYALWRILGPRVQRWIDKHVIGVKKSYLPGEREED
jgi:hypothetical protein